MSWEVRTMQSKTSYFNATLFRKNLTRFWPLWGLASFVGALFPLAVLLDMVHRGWNVLSAPDFTGMYYDAVSAVPVINLVYAALCAMAVWSYLYNARSVGLMHTLPIRREGLFLTNFLSGLSMTLIPYAVTGVLCVVVSLCGGAFDAKGLAVTVLAVLGESFFYFSSATFVAFITGNAFTMPPLYALLHFLAVLLDWLISSFAQGFIFGFSTYYTGVVEWLSPTVYLVNNVRCARQYVEVQQTFPDGTPYTSRLLTSADLESFWLIGVYALVGLALAALALILYRRRRSETAGDVVAVGWLRPVFRYGVAGLCALLGGLLGGDVGHVVGGIDHEGHAVNGEGECFQAEFFNFLVLQRAARVADLDEPFAHLLYAHAGTAAVMRIPGLAVMMRLAASFMTGIWAVPPAISRVPFMPLKASRGAATAVAARRSVAARAGSRNFFMGSSQDTSRG